MYSTEKLFERKEIKKEFNEILDSFLVEIEKNPDKNIDDVICEVSSALRDADKSLSKENLMEIERSLNCIDDISKKMHTIIKARDDGFTRDDWFVSELKKKLDEIPLMTDSQKFAVISSVVSSVKDAFKKQ